MSNSKTKINFNPDNWKIKITERTKGRMKFQIKLSAEEAEAFTKFSDSVKPDNVSMGDFTRSIFFSGIRTLEEQLTQNLVKHMEDNREEFEEKGFIFDDDGKLTGAAEEQVATSDETLEVIED